MRAPFRWAIAAAVGAVSVAGFAPAELFPLPVFALAVLFAMLTDSASIRSAAMLGFSFGLGLFGTGVSWIYVSLHDHGGMPAPLAGLAVLLFCAFLALFPAIAGALFTRFRGGAMWRDVLLAAAAWTLTEWVRGWIMSGFPWLVFGYSQAPPSPLAGYAAVTGAYGLSFLIAALGGALALAVVSPSRRRVMPGAVTLLAVVALGGLLLGRIDWTRPVGEPVSVRLVQTNIPQSLKWQPELIGKWLSKNLQMVEDNPARLVVLPETTLPLSMEDLPPGYLDRLQDAGRRAGGDVLFGIFTREDGAGGVRYFNTAVSLGTAMPQQYRKTHLVAFGEFSPPGLSWVFRWLSIPMSDQSPGPVGQPPLALAGQQVAVNICYEDAFGEEIIRSLPQATLLLNMTNTAWFGHSLAQPQHLQMSQLRALESGRVMLRATNTGVTAVISPHGEVTARLPEFEEGVLSATVSGHAGLTPYARTGNAVVIGLAFAIVVLAAMGRRSVIR